MVVFRDQNLNIDGFEGFAQCLGCFGDAPFIAPVEGHPNVLRCCENTTKKDRYLAADGIAIGVSNQRVQVPPPLRGRGHDEGGDTAYTNQYLAFDTLSDSMQTLLDGLTRFTQPNAATGLLNFRATRPGLLNGHAR